MKKILPIILVTLGVATGGGAGMLFKPTAKVPDQTSKSAEDEFEKSMKEELDVAAVLEDEPGAFVKINNQFVIPVVDETRVKALVVLSISMKVGELSAEAIYNREPLLRDTFLQVLFDHAYMGGFDGVYTVSSKMDMLKSALLRAAKKVSGDDIQRILITDIVRQDL